MKNSIYIFLFIPFLAFGQLSPTTEKPYMLVSSARVATSTESDLDDHTKAVTTIQYMDGLGRQMQAVGYKTSPIEKDMLMGTNTLDNLGRTKRSYLPVSVSANTNQGKYQSNAPNLAQTFYSDTAPYNEVETYEASPLSRAFKTVGAGQAFRPSPSTQKGINQSLFTAGAEVRKYLLSEDINGDITVSGSLNFANGDLIKTTVTDEEGNTVSEFTDREGRIIEKRVISASNSTDILITAYIYDDIGRLRYVIPPKAYGLATFTEDSNPNDNNAYFNEGIYAIHYDTRGRVAEQHTPNGGWSYTIYNELDQVVMTQNSFQRESNLWEWVRHDGHGRKVMAGTWINSADRATVQGYFLSFLNSNQFEERSTAGGNLYGYTNRSFPSNVNIQASDVKQVYYFDDYTWFSESNLEFQLYSTPKYTNVKGLATGSIVKLLDNTGTALKSVMYYDDKNRMIQTIVQNRFGGINQMDKVYTFSGECLEERLIYRKPSTPDEIIKTKYSLDHTGRVKNATIQYNSDASVPLANYKYDEIGRLVQKRLQEVEKEFIERENEVLTNGQVDMAQRYILLKQGTYNATNGTYCAIVNAGVLQIIDYAYNIRGQLKSINGGALNASEGDIFAMDLSYHEDNRYFNGLISKQTWKSSTQANNRGFTYSYDGFTRLKSADYVGVNSENYSLGNVLYDANGNITNLERAGLSGANTYGQIDNLTYHYPNYSNRLTGIEDNSNKTKGFKDNNSSSDYTYYSDGKLKTDDNKGITNISYNYLGLPQQIDFGATKHIENLYNADGQKLRETFVNGSQTIVIDYMGDLIYYDGVLKTILHDEGRIAFKPDNSHTYQFFLQDHLGNTRVVVERLNENTALVQENHYGAWGEILEGIGQTGDWNFLYQGKELIEGLGYDFHSRLYDEWSGRFMQIDGANQFASGYTGMGNNPASLIDPDGQFVIAGITGFFKGLLTNRNNFETGADTRVGNAFASSFRHMNNSIKITAGLFASDRNKGGFWGRAWETVSRFTWQLPQTAIGYGYSQIANLVKRVDGVRYYGGATFVQGGGSGRGSVALGSYINLAQYDVTGIDGDDEAQFGVFGAGGYTFMHEYGHYLQSRRMGFLYLFKVGIPSANSIDWTEHDANLRAAQYFSKHEGFRWNENYFPAGFGEEEYSQFPASRRVTNGRFWEYLFVIQHPILSALYYYRNSR